MKIIASFLVVGTIIGLMIYASGGPNVFWEHLFSLKGQISSVEEFNLDEKPNTVAEIGSTGIRKPARSSKSAAHTNQCAITTSTAEKNVVLNEIAWMGSEGDAKREWIELKNISSSDLSLAGWELRDKSGRIDVHFSNEHIFPNGFHIVSRGSDFTGTINNSDEALYLFDSHCELHDIVVADSKWPAGDAKKWTTAERSPDLGWHTSQAAGGTPNKENSVAANADNESVKGSNVNVRPIVTSTIRISEVMAGAKNDADFEFVELFNASDLPISLSGSSIKKRSSTGAESTLVSEGRLNGKVLPAHSYLLFANEKGYVGSVKADIVWPSSYSLSGNKNGIVVYDARNTVIDSVHWDKIPDGSSLVRDGWDIPSFHLSDAPTPQTGTVL